MLRHFTRPVFQAITDAAGPTDWLRERPVLGFAGIGAPERFEQTQGRWVGREGAGRALLHQRSGQRQRPHHVTTADVGPRLGTSAAWRLNVLGESSGTFRDGVDLMRYAVFPAFTLRLGENTSVTVDYEHLYDKRTADRGIPSQNGLPFDTARSTFFGNADQSVARSYNDAFSATVDHDINSSMHLKNTLRVTHYDKYYQNVFAGSAVNAAQTLTLSAYNNNNDRTNLFNQTDLVTRFTTGPIAHQLRHNRRSRVPRQSPDASVPFSVYADGEIKFTRTGQQNAKVRSEDRIGRRLQGIVGFERAGAHAKHQVAAVLGGRHRERGSWTDAHLTAAGQAKD